MMDSTPNPKREAPAGQPDAGKSAAFPFAPQGGAPAARDPWAGKYLGPYLVQRMLARGGMGVVLLGYDEGLRRFAAIKVMDSELAGDEDAAKRFEREARACAAIDHPNVARIYLVSISEEGVPFLAMEYLEGGSLVEVLRRKEPVPYSRFVHIMEQVAEGLGAGRKLNIIHRDIKPANLMLSRDGRAKVVDFGLAKMVFEDSYRTREGTVLGTPTYMAPEQTQGRGVDHRADIYSLGATFYHLVVRRPPFRAESPVQTMMKHVTAPLPSMRSIEPTVPLEFDDIIARCMRKDPNERYQEYQELISDLKAARLQFLSREKHGTAAASPAAAAPDLHAATVRSHGSDAVTVRDATWTPTRVEQAEESRFPAGAILSAGGLLLAAVAAWFLLFGGSGNGGREGQPGMVAALPSALEDVDDLEAYRATLDALEALRRGLHNHEVSTNNYPESLGTLVTDNWMLANFDLGLDDWPLDGWGTPFSYDRRDRTLAEIRSAGRDGKFFTSDDLVMNTGEEEVAVPDVYRRLEEDGRGG